MAPIHRNWNIASVVAFLIGAAAGMAPGGPPASWADAQGHRAPIAACPATAPKRDAALGLPAWVALGPFGGDVEGVAASPANASIVLAGVAPASGGGGALYRSTDAGATWSIVAALNGISVFDVVFAPDGTAYAGTLEGVWKSTDHGANWTQLSLGIGLNDAVLELSIDPSNPSIIWAGIDDALGGQPVNVMRSTNAGATWFNRTPPLPSPMSCRGLAVDPANSAHVCAAFGGAFGGGQVWISGNGGTSWINRSAGLPGNPMNDILHDGSRVLVCGGQLFGSQFVGVYESLNDGVTWTALHDGSWPLLVIDDLEIDPNDSGVILAASAGAGVFRTDNGGDTWTFGIGGTGSLSLNAVRFAPAGSSVIYLGASSAGVLASGDGGASFEPSSTGIGALNTVSIEVNPIDTGELAIAFQGLNDGGVQTSLDGGSTWTLEPVPPTRYITVRFAPDGTLYAISDGPSSIAPEGLYRREGNGSWTGIGPDQGTLFESELAALRFSRNDPALIITGGADFGVAGFEATVWHTPDGGETWQKTYEGPVDSEHVTAIEIVEDGSDAVMVASFTDFGEAQTGGALRSIDGGLSWSESSAGLPSGAQGTGLCASPGDVDTFFLADGDLGIGLGGLHVSTNAGETWASSGFHESLIQDVVCDPSDDQVMYAARLFGTLAFRSEDQGATFVPFSTGLEAAGNAEDLGHAAGTQPRLLLATSTGAYARNLGIPCPWDCGDGDGNVGIVDLLALLGGWGGPGACDSDGGGAGITDLLELLAHWGACP